MEPHLIIHAASAAAAGIGAGLAQLPGSDAPALMSLQTAMILALAEHFQVAMHRAAAADMVLTLSATMTGRWISQVLIGWVPGYGNAVNATTAATITEAIGWAAVAMFEAASNGGVR